MRTNLINFVTPKLFFAKKVSTPFLTKKRIVETELIKNQQDILEINVVDPEVVSYPETFKPLQQPKQQPSKELLQKLKLQLIKLSDFIAQYELPKGASSAIKY